MTRPFSPRDTLRVRHLQSAGCSLDLEADVLIGRSPLRLAVGACLPLASGRVATLVSPRGDGPSAGFVQARWRRDRLTADLTFIAPDLNGAPGVAHVWQRLVTAACQHLGEFETQRVFASVGEDDRVALQVFRQLGFTPYTNDTVFRLETSRSDEGAGQPPADDFGDQVGQDATTGGVGYGELEEGYRGNGGTVIDADTLHEPTIARLYSDGLPEGVRAHEDLSGAGWTRYPAGGWPVAVTPLRALLDERGVVKAAWRIFRGPRGLWLQIIAGPGGDAGEAVMAARADARKASARGLPLFCAARGYEPGLNLALRDGGFEPVVRRFRLVKHTTARVLEPSWSQSAVRDRGLDPAPTRTSSAQSEAVKGRYETLKG